MRDPVPPAGRDRLFLFATEAVHDPAAGRWDLYVDPADCLVSLDGDEAPTIDAVRRETVTVTEADGKRRYEGRILLGAGVVPLVGDAVPLIFRDADAPTSPLRWTAPAGRVDAAPRTTAFREFYEELLVFHDGAPAYVDAGAPEMREHYLTALAENGVPTDDVGTVSATVPERFRRTFETVVTHVGDDRRESALWVTWLPDTSSLEFRAVLALDADPDRLAFRDGELDRCVELFPTEQLASVPAGALVPGLAAFRDAFFEG